VRRGGGRSRHPFATQAHEIIDGNKIIMATESTEEHGKIKSITMLGAGEFKSFAGAH
jgi:acyl-CoA hydrolase